MNGRCPSYKAPGFPAKVGGIFQCAYCGTLGPVPAGQVNCLECDSPEEHVEHVEHVQILVKAKRNVAEAGQRAEAKEKARKRARRNLLASVALIAAAWFLCVAPVARWFEQEGVTMDTVVPTAAPRLSQVQIQATQQAEVVQRTAAFEDIEVRVGETEKWEAVQPNGGIYIQCYLTFLVFVRNNGAVPHEVLLWYKTGGMGDAFKYESISLAPSEEIQFYVRYNAFSGIPGSLSNYRVGRFDFKARLESVDGVLREETSWGSQNVDWTIILVDDTPLREYELVGQ